MKHKGVSEIEQFYKIELIQLLEGENEYSKTEFYKNENTFSVNSDGEIEKINLKDNNLETLIGLREVRNTVTHLNLAGTRLTKIDELSEFKNLKYLDLSTNHISDIKPISKLQKLQNLLLDNNKIEIIPLFDLPNLNEIWLYSNSIVNIENLQTLDNLFSLNIGSNKIENILPIKRLEKLKHITYPQIK